MKKYYLLIFTVTIIILSIFIYKETDKDTKIQEKFNQKFPNLKIINITQNDNKTGIITTNSQKYLYFTTNNEIIFSDNLLLIKEYESLIKNNSDNLQEKITNAYNFIQENTKTSEEEFLKQRKALWEKASMLTYTISLKNPNAAKSKLNVYYDTPKEQQWRQQQNNPYTAASLSDLNKELKTTITEYNQLIDKRDKYYIKFKETLPYNFQELNNSINSGLRRWMKIKYMDYKLTFVMPGY